MSEKMMINLSVIEDAIENATNGWNNYYNVVTGKIESVPDLDNNFADAEDFEEICEKIDNSKDYVRLPSQRELHEYGIMERFAETKNDIDLKNSLRGRRPFRSFKDTAAAHGYIDEYYRYRTEAFADISRRWCKDNAIPYIENIESEQILRIKHFESILDKANAGLNSFDSLVEKIEKMFPEIDELESYYGSEDWKKDFADDESGKLPSSLKRGVLSEDGIYDLLERIKEMKAMLKGSE